MHGGSGSGGGGGGGGGDGKGGDNYEHKRQCFAGSLKEAVEKKKCKKQAESRGRSRFGEMGDLKMPRAKWSSLTRNNNKLSGKQCIHTGTK